MNDTDTSPSKGIILGALISFMLWILICGGMLLVLRGMEAWR